MSDDLARLTNAELARRMRENRETPFCREIIDDLLDEAATRLATPPGDAVEVVAEKLCDGQIIALAKLAGGEQYGPMTWNITFKRDALLAFARTIERRAAPSIPEAHGEQMREAAARVADTFAHDPDDSEFDRGYSTAAASIASVIRALPLPLTRPRTGPVPQPPAEEPAARARQESDTP
jgi:hypothetical protein